MKWKSRKKLFIFYQKKAVLKTETTKNSLCFRKRNFLLFEETGTLKNVLHFRKWLSVLEKWKETTLKKFPIFQEMELSNLKLLKTSYILETNLQGRKIKLFKHKYKRKKFLILLLIKKQNFLNWNNFL